MNGNTQFGTASPNGNTTVNGWLDQAPLSAYSAGVVSGFAVSPVLPAGFNLHVGGTAGINDFAIIKNQNGDSDTVAGNTGTPYTIAIPSVPGTSGQSQVNSIIIYKDPTLTTTIANGVDTIGLTVIQGTAAASGSQVAPTDATIRAGITNGSVIYYAVIANVTLTYGATGINATNIQSNLAKISSSILPESVATWVPATAPSGWGGTFSYCLLNKHLSLDMPGTSHPALTSGSSTILGTLPSSIYSLMTVALFTTFIVSGATTAVSGYIKIDNTNGNVSIVPNVALAAGTFIAFSFNYLLH